MADYCTTTQVKGAGRLNVTDAGYDTQLGEMITAASRWIDRHCAGDIVDAFAVSTTATTRYFPVEETHGKVLYLDAPLLSVTTLTNGDSVVIASSDYRLWPRNSAHHYEIHLLSDAGWSFDEDGEIEVSGKWGLALSGSTPAPVTEACAMLAAWMFKRYQAALADATANYDLGQLVYGEAMPKQVLALLEPYRVVL